MKCKECKHPNPAKARFCNRCGATLGKETEPARSTVRAGSGGAALGKSVAAGKKGVAVGRDVHGGVRVNSPTIVQRVSASSSPRALLRGYLDALVRECAPLRLKTIDQRAAGPSREPLGLTSVYVDLNLEWRISAKMSLKKLLSKMRRGESIRTRFVPESGTSRLVPALEALASFPHMALLGAPGSGKSTLSTYVVLALAETRLGSRRALGRLGPWWSFGALVPMRIVLRQFAASLPQSLERGRAKHLWDFIDADLANCGLPSQTGTALRRIVQKEGAFWILDGLDEMKDPTIRARVAEAVSEFVDQAPTSFRFLLTSRPYAWEEMEQIVATAVDPHPDRGAYANLLSSFPTTQRLADFEPQQMQTFIERWYRAISALGWISAKDAREKAPELQGAVQRDDHRPLARNPLLLTLMATLHSNRTRLPDDRADLYNEVVELLLQRWNETIGADRGLLDALQVPSLKLSDLRGELEQVAFNAHGGHAGKDGAADIPEGDLVAALKPLLGGRADKADLVVEYIERRAGLLLGQGPRGRQRQFSFPHRTFQEFLAGCHLAGMPDFETKVVQLATVNPRHWREVLKFAARRATASRGVPASAVLVCNEDADHWLASHAPTDADWRKAVLAGEQLLEIGLASVNSRPEYEAVRRRVAKWLVSLIERGVLPAQERVEAGSILARLGDPRKGVVPHSARELEEMEFCYVPPGAFWMGEGEPSRVEIGYEFWISRHPVTVAQFELFLKAGGYREAKYWAEAKTAKVWRDGRVKGKYEKEWMDEPWLWQERLRFANHPVSGVCWYEALAFCRWLTELCEKNGLPSGYRIGLSSETEWEKAARGGEQVLKKDNVRRLVDGLSVWGEPSLTANPEPQRIYPWRGEFDANKANSAESGIDGTSAAGCFPDGASACGALDMVGNVWEWTRSEEEGTRVLRGGAFGVGAGYVRCACRDWGDPDFRFDGIGFRVVASPSVSDSEL